MSSSAASERDKRALYWLGERLIDYRHPVSIIVILVTAFFAYKAFQLKLETSFGRSANRHTAKTSTNRYHVAKNRVNPSNAW